MVALLVGVKRAVYSLAEVAAKFEIEPPETRTSSFVKSVDSAESEKLMTAVLPAARRSEVLLVMVTVGEAVLTGNDRVLVARLKLP